jgi:hypothetical protein
MMRLLATVAFIGSMFLITAFSLIFGVNGGTFLLALVAFASGVAMFVLPVEDPGAER